ncbi:MAG TPA: FAD-binding oxidoreductase [Chloroflexi bacterium]|nr:FAD-binding oxidoreductase [Chloroflexota bacterium]
MATTGAYDAIVIGAGLSGALVASSLAEEGLHVVVLDARENPGGTMARQPGLALLGTACPFTVLGEMVGEDTALTIWEMTSEGLVRLEILLDQLGLQHTQPGSIRLATNQEESRALRRSAGQLREFGYRVRLEGEGEAVAMHTEDDLIFDANHLIQRLLDHDHIIVEPGTEAHRISYREDGTIAVWAHHHYLWAETLVVASGAYVARLLLPLRDSFRVQAVHTLHLSNPDGLSSPILIDSGRFCYLPDGSGAYLSGWDGHGEMTLERLAKVASQICPDASVRSRFTVYTASTPDGLPLVGQPDPDRNLYVIGGFGPLGISLVLPAAEALLGLMLEGEGHPLFSLARPNIGG